MSIRSYPASQADGEGYEILNTRFHGKELQVALVWTLAGIEEAFPPTSAVSHMRYIDEDTVIAGDVAQALDIVTAGDCLVLLCANRQVCSGVRDYLQAVA